MEEQKYCIRHRLSNGTYLAVLNNGWRYDGSVVVEADTERELECKLSQARYDDRWVTLNGSHILIGGTGRIKSGAGGRLKGRMFGMNFSDYEHGKKSKKGKKLIRVYKPMKKTGESKKAVAGNENKKASVKQITKHEEIENAMTHVAGFSTVRSSFFNNIDKQLAVKNANQILNLEHKFGVIHQSKAVLTSTNEGSATVGFVERNPIFPCTQTLSLCGNYFSNPEKLKRAEEYGQATKHNMPALDENLDIYTVTHEYGHMIQNMLIQRRMKADGWQEDKADAFVDEDGANKTFDNYYVRGYSYNQAKRAAKATYLKWYTDRKEDVVDECRREIIAIAKKNNKKFKLKDNISEYGSKTNASGKAEFFAEVFANSQLGKPNELGIAMQQWLVQKGLVINE
jgi:hypothetical protein